MRRDVIFMRVVSFHIADHWIIGERALNGTSDNGEFEELNLSRK